MQVVDSVQTQGHLKTFNAVVTPTKEPKILGPHRKADRQSSLPAVTAAVVAGKNQCLPPMKPRHLASMLIALTLFGMGVIGYVAHASLQPSEQAKANRPRVVLPALEPAQFAYIADPMAADNWPSHLLVVRKPDGDLRVWRMPLRNGLHSLPDVHWWQQGPTCQRFEPDFTTGTIACRDANLGSWGSEPYRWNLDGKNLGLSRHVDDMDTVEGALSADEYVFADGRQLP